MFSFFKNRPTPPEVPFSLAPIESDWHCHILPGIDDGSQNEEQSLAMLQEYVKLGIKKIVATPHVRADYFKNTKESIAGARDKVQALIDTHRLPLMLETSAEYFADENFLQLIERDELLPIEEQYLLFELPMQSPALWGTQLAEKLQRKGFTPVLAHPERYRYWHGKPREWQQWKNRGVCFQLNLLSVTGFYGAAEARAAKQLLDADYIDAVGSDAHGLRHLEKLKGLSDNPYFDRLQQLPLLNRLG
ncbi:MAG: CpsB/CapC family capsule biosynthesis tyrosine phosphatase [Spirosomataceae bacterium]